MGWNDHVDFELSDALEALIEDGYLEKGTPAYGVAQQVIHSGIGSLSSRQKQVYDAVVNPALQKRGKRLRGD